MSRAQRELTVTAPLVERIISPVTGSVKVLMLESNHTLSHGALSWRSYGRALNLFQGFEEAAKGTLFDSLSTAVSTLYQE